MRKFLVTFILIFICTGLSADNLSNIPAAFIDVGYGARPMSMGGSYISLVKDANSIIWNPAGLANLPGKHSISIDNVTLLDLYNYSFLGYGMKINDKISVGSGFIYSGDEVMSESTLFLSLGIDGVIFGNPILQRLKMGLSLKYFGSSFGNNTDGSYVDDQGEHQVSGSANGFGLDLGLQYKISKENRVGIMAKNLVNDIFWKSSNGTGTAQGDYNEGIPTTLIFGYSLSKSSLVFSLDYDKSLYEDVEDIIHTGAEYSLLNGYLALRGGFSQEIFTGDNRRYTLGIGTKLNIWKNSLLYFDAGYEIQTQWEGGNTLRISMNIVR